MRTTRLLADRRLPWQPTYYCDFRTQAARNFTSDHSDYTDSKGVVWTQENYSAATTLSISSNGWRIRPSGSTTISGSTRTSPLVRCPAAALGVTSEHMIIHSCMELTVETGGTNTGGVVMWEAASGNNNTRNYIGDSGGTSRISSQVTIGGTQTVVGNYDPVGGLAAVIRLEQVTGLGGDHDWYGNGAVVTGLPVLADTLAGRVAMTPLTNYPFGWDRGGNFAPDATGRFLLSAVGQATVTLRWLYVEVLDLGRG